MEPARNLHLMDGMNRSAKEPVAHPETEEARLRWRWWGAAAGIAVGLADTATMAALGVSFGMNGHDVTLFVGGYFGVSFAVLGFLLGHLYEMRRRDRRNAALLRAQTETISAARARLVQSEKLAALGQLATAIAHEVRNPLGVIRSAAQDVAESLPHGDGDGRRACSFITDEIDRLNNVIGSLLAFARPPRLSPQRVAVGELFESALLLAADELRAKQLRVRRDVAPGLPGIEADPDLVSQVLLGLLANATEVSQPGGEVTVEARATEGAVELAVADRGPGVAVDLRARVFEPFFTTRSRGTGLGLAVARQIVEAHGGSIDVGDRPGGGARFALRLPAAKGSAIAA
jgi:two-component system sensor histidine kinase HydH